MGVEAPPLPEAPLLREALTWWLETYVKGKSSYEKVKHSVELHLTYAAGGGGRTR